MSERESSVASRSFIAAAVFALAAMLGSPAGVAAAPDAVVEVPVLEHAPALDGDITGWSRASQVSLRYDFNSRRNASENTSVYVAQDSAFLDVAFVVQQRESVTDGQHSNGPAVQSDDYVGVYLYPTGTQGFAYGFFVNPRGAQYQTSSENAAYTPQWPAAARRTSDGYVVEMRLPLRSIRSAGASTWRAQFVRQTVVGNSLAVWAFSATASTATDPAYIGTLTHVGAAVASTTQRPRPRVQLYALAELTTPKNGGNTSRTGADLSVPVTPTASFVATLHPDYSNVEIDQQTITPSAFPRQYGEPRPFFSQVGSFFNGTFACNNCPQSLYTPAIPVFSQGYALEGTQGRFNFAAFDAIGGDGRHDDAQTVNYLIETPERQVAFNTQRVVSDGAGYHDSTTSLNAAYQLQKSHLFVYSNNSFESGTGVTDAAQAKYVEDGVGYGDATTTLLVGYQKVGAQFNPADGYVQQTDTAGLQIFGSKSQTFGRGSRVQGILVSDYVSRFRDSSGGLSQVVESFKINLDLRNQFSLRAALRTQAVASASGELLPFNSTGAILGYRLSTIAPTYVQYSAGAYYHGRADFLRYITTARLSKRAHLALEADRSAYYSHWAAETDTKQWLQRASLDVQVSKATQIELGLRRIFGANLPNSYQLPGFAPGACASRPHAPGCPFTASNVSFAFHTLSARNEFYVVYGDPNSLATTPAVFFKFIRYIGSEKGT